jgi:hypothetical protein
MSLYIGLPICNTDCTSELSWKSTIFAHAKVGLKSASISTVQVLLVTLTYERILCLAVANTVCYRLQALLLHASVRILPLIVVLKPLRAATASHCTNMHSIHVTD